jgi:hypothetical protein
MTKIDGRQLREWFADWVRSGGRIMGPGSLAALQADLAEMPEKLPDDVCQKLGLPSGSSYGHAARTMIIVRDQDGVEGRLNTIIKFDSEDASLAWWREHKDDPDRVRLAHVRDGSWQLDIAP